MAKILLKEGSAPDTPAAGYIAPYATTDSEFLIKDDTGLVIKPPYRKGADVASAATVNLDTATGDLIDVTGTVTITAITLAEGKQCIVRFAGALQLTVGASLILNNNAANYTTTAGDFILFRGYAASVVRGVIFPIDGESPSGNAAAATQTELEAASAANVYSSPGRQQFHPGHPKAWVNFNSAGTIAASYNITSITDTGTGDWTVNIATDFSTSNYAGIITGGYLSTPVSMIYNMRVAPTAGAYRIRTETSAGGNDLDPDTPNQIHVVFLGDQ